MTKIGNPITDETRNKLYGVMPAIIDSAEVSEEKTSNKKPFTLLTLNLTLENGSENGLTRKIFCRLPWDNWEPKPGEDESLFRQLRKATGMTTEECNDTVNYKGKGFHVVLGPQKQYKNPNEWNTFQSQSGDTRLSYNVISILTEAQSASEDEKKKLDAEMTMMSDGALAELKGEKDDGGMVAADAIENLAF